MNVDINDLKYNKNGIEYEYGYRIVYFYDDSYRVGEYCKTIDGFMIGFTECAPIISEEDIPKFISNKDLLSRYLNEFDNINCVAIYDTNGNCIDKLVKNHQYS